MIPVVFLHGIGGGAKLGAADRELRCRRLLSCCARPAGLRRARAGRAMSFEALAEDVEFAICGARWSGRCSSATRWAAWWRRPCCARRPDGYARPCSPAHRRRSATRPATSRRSSWRTASPRWRPEHHGGYRARRDAGMMGPNPDPAGRALFVEEYAAAGSDLSGGRAMPRRRSTSAPISPNIKVPVLCLAAEHDRNAPPAMVEKMPRKIPGARYVCLPGLGHMPNLEAPGLRRGDVLLSSPVRSAH